MQDLSPNRNKNKAALSCYKETKSFGSCNLKKHAKSKNANDSNEAVLINWTTRNVPRLALRRRGVI